MKTTMNVFATGLMVAVLVTAWGSTPADAHGGDGESDPVNLVEQALAIVVNTPDAPGEALERIEEALAEEAEEPSGELDLVALEDAAVALEEARLHDAEDALVRALGLDPHLEDPEPADRGEVAEPVEQAPPADVAQPQAPPEPEEAVDTSPDDSNSEAEATAEHGLTSRVEGGFIAPTPSGWPALGVALLLAVGGIAFVAKKGTDL
ncbi:MAG: hypothetical protein ACC658_09040 [Acidimicrobiia bacterium]